MAHRSLQLAPLILALALTGTSASAQGAGAQEATYVVSGLAFEGPDTIPAGMTTITVDNQVDREDLFALIAIGGGRTLDDFFMAMGQLFAGELSVIPEWIEFYGGSPIGAHDQRTYTIFLSPGTYYLLSIEADEQGPLAAQGMLLPIEVTAPDRAFDIAVTLEDYEFVIDGTFAAGTQMVRVHNAAHQPHEMLIIPLPPGVTLEELLAAPEGEPGAGEEGMEEPGGPGGAPEGVWVINPGETVFVPVSLQPGSYGLICFVPDADGPHALQGMNLEIEVQ